MNNPNDFIQKVLRKNVEKETNGAITVLFDESGLPSYMLRIPKFKVETIDSSLGFGVHPAFIVNGKEIDEIFIGITNACLFEGKAYSLPDERPHCDITFDKAREACSKKGAGWHLMTNWEYAALVMYLVKNRITYFEKPRWDWIDGFKIVDGEIFAPKDNDIALSENEWPSMGIFFDDVEGKPQISKKITHYTEPDPKGKEDERYDGYTYLSKISELEFFVRPEKDERDLTPAEIRMLGQMLILPTATPVISEVDASLYIRNYGERLPIRGGYWSGGSNAGLGVLYLNYRRSYSNSGVGFRPAFIKLEN